MQSFPSRRMAPRSWFQLRFTLILVALIAAAPGCYAQAPAQAQAQRVPADRLPVHEFDVTPPTERVRGEPGDMHTLKSACRVLPTATPTTETRRRIIDIAAQEWGFFGFPIRDQTVEVARPRVPRGKGKGTRRRGRRRPGDPVEGERVAATIGGYWAATPEGFWVVDQQNQAWGEDGLGARWNSPWSAAFISWVMCEAGLGDTSQFKRAVAHHTYIDQAIQARDTVRNGGTPAGAFLAYDPGERPVEAGDLLCSARRPAFRSIAERRRQLGEGGSMHCDIVVKVEEAAGRYLTIGGNVGGRVSLKIMAAVPRGEYPGPSSTAIFAHLKLRTDPIEPAALDHTPTMKAAGSCPASTLAPNQLAALRLVSPGRAPVTYC